MGICNLVSARILLQLTFSLMFLTPSPARPPPTSSSSTNHMMASVSKSPVLPKWQSITLPLIAGLLHLQVFYYAAVHCLLRVGSSNDITSDEFRNECFLLDRAIFLAYVFDLLCCWFKVIPFSRTYNIICHIFI